jgi:hypothetical protein
MTRSFSRSASSIAILIMVAAIPAAACTAGQGAVSSIPGSTTRASAMVAPSAVPSPRATPAATLAVLPEGDSVGLTPGRYAFPSRGINPAISFTVPSGWAGGSTLVEKDYGDNGPAAPFMWDWYFDHGFKNPCTDHTPVVPAAGSGASGLLAVVARQPGIDPGPIHGGSVAGIKDVTVGGHDGKYVDYTVTADPAKCGNGQDGFWIWGACPPPVTVGCEDADSGDRRWGASKGNHERAYAIDVDGTIYTFFTAQPRRLLAADRAEFQRFLDSIKFEPATS